MPVNGDTWPAEHDAARLNLRGEQQDPQSHVWATTSSKGGGKDGKCLAWG